MENENENDNKIRIRIRIILDAKNDNLIDLIH